MFRFNQISSLKKILLMLFSAFLFIFFLTACGGLSSRGAPDQSAYSDDSEPVPQRNQSKDTGQTEGDASGNEGNQKTSEAGTISFSLQDRILNLTIGQDYQISPAAEDNETAGETSALDPSLFRWTSSDDTVARVDGQGRLEALDQGSAVIRCRPEAADDKSSDQVLCVNVCDPELSQGACYDLEMLVPPDLTDAEGSVESEDAANSEESGDFGTGMSGRDGDFSSGAGGSDKKSEEGFLIYRNYAQGGWIYDEYGDYNEYVARHGCAACCTATMIGAWFPEEDWSPDRVISELEPEASPEGFEKNYSKPMAKQMPLTLKGISRILELKEIPHIYIDKFEKEEAVSDITRHLKKGLPVIYEAGRGGIHMMMILGIMADGSFLLSDSVGQNRIRISSVDSVMDQMFSCKKEPSSSYYAGRAAAGGYIKVGE